MLRFCSAVVVSFILSLDVAHAASFACNRARAPDERAICADRGLNDSDVRMATMFELLSGLFAMGQRGDMGEAQQRWLVARHACGGHVACLRKSYARRIGELRAIYDQIDKPI